MAFRTGEIEYIDRAKRSFVCGIENIYPQRIENLLSQIPEIRESMPLTKNSKVDFNALKNEPLDGSEINVDVSETNLTVDHIEIYKDTKKSKTRIKKQIKIVTLTKM